MGPYIDTPRMCLQDPIWDAIVKIIMRDYKIEIDITAYDINVLVRFVEDYATWIDYLRFIGADGRYDVIVMQVGIDLQWETAIVCRRPKDDFYPLLR